jgi:oligosaccharide repeat unit polymerase
LESFFISMYCAIFLSSAFVINKIFLVEFNTHFNFISIFSVWWLITLAIAIINPKDFYKISNASIFIFYITPFFIIFGYFIVQIITRHKNSPLFIPVLIFTKLNSFYMMISIMLALFSLMMLAFALKFSLDSGLSMQEFRNLVYSNEGHLINPIYDRISPILWFVLGLNLFLLFYFIYHYIFLVEKNAKLYLLINIAIRIILTLITGGRGAFVELIFIAFACLVVVIPMAASDNNNFLINLKRKKLLKKSGIMLLLMLIFLTIITILRDDSQDKISIVESMYNSYIIYNTGPFFTFDQMIQTGILLDFKLDRFGMSFLGLDIIAVSGVARFLLGLDVPSLLSQTSHLMHQGVMIQKNQAMNAHYTLLLGPLIDGGVYFIAFFLIGIGAAYKVLCIHLRKGMDWHLFSLLILFYLLAFNSTRINLFQDPATTICIVLIFLSKIFTNNKGGATRGSIR